MTPLSPTLEWYALHTRSRHEKMVEQSLAQKDFTVFLPTVEVKSRRRDRRKLYQKPLFPGYLFVETLLLPEHHAAIRKTPGICSILGLGHEGGPTPVPRDQVESLRVLVGSGTDLDPYEYLKEGQYVEVVAGPLKGATGILVEKQRKKQRLIVSLDIMNQAVSASLEACEVEPYRKS